MDFKWMKDVAMRDAVRAEYKRLRAVTLKQFGDNLHNLCDADLLPLSAKRFGIDVEEEDGKPCFMFDSESEMHMVGDFAQMLDDQKGKPARIKYIEKYAESENADERETVALLKTYRYTWLRPLRANPGFGVKCMDLLEERELMLVDVNFSEHFRQNCGFILASGLLAFGDPERRCFMTTGSGIPFPDVIDRKLLDFTLADLEIKSRPPTILNDAEMADFAAWSAKAAREAGTRDRVHYE